jgi:hypothetical protein
MKSSYRDPIILYVIHGALKKTGGMGNGLGRIKANKK